MSIADVEARIRGAVIVAKTKGLRIIKDAYWDGKRGCCPVAACVLDQIAEASQRAEVPWRASTVLCIEPIQATKIAIGLDGRCDWCQTDPWFSLGVRLRDLVDA